MTTAMQRNNAPTSLQPVGTQNDLRAMLEKNKAWLAGVLPRHLTAEKLIKIALMAAGRTPKLLECSQRSIILAIMQAAALGLEIGGVLGHAYLVPFKNRYNENRLDAQLVPGYKGLVHLARNGGEIKKFVARVVHQRDKFFFAYGLDERLMHEPTLDGDPGGATHFYAIAEFTSGEKQWEVMTRTQVDAIRARSRAAGDETPWGTDYEEMGKKTVVKRVSKMLPLSVEFHAAVALDNRAEGADDDALDIPGVDESKLEGLEEPQKMTAPPAPDKKAAPKASTAPTPPPQLQPPGPSPWVQDEVEKMVKRGEIEPLTQYEQKSQAKPKAQQHPNAPGSEAPPPSSPPPSKEKEREPGEDDESWGDKPEPAAAQSAKVDRDAPPPAVAHDEKPNGAPPMVDACVAALLKAQDFQAVAKIEEAVFHLPADERGFVLGYYVSALTRAYAAPALTGQDVKDIDARFLKLRTDNLLRPGEQDTALAARKKATARLRDVKPPSGDSK